MSDTDVDTRTASGVKIPRFHGRRGDDYTLWRHRLRAACRIKNVWSVVNVLNSTTSSASGTIEPSTPTVVSPPGSAAKREMACGIIISALGDAPLRVVMDVDDDPSRMLSLLDARCASNRTVSRIAVQTQLFRMSYKGQDMSSYVDQYTSLFSQLERMGKEAAIPESHKAPMLLASIDPSCFLESTAAALRTKETSELSWEYVATTLIDEYNAKTSSGTSTESSGDRLTSKSSKRIRRRNKSKYSSKKSNDSDESDIDPTAKAIAAALQTMGKSGSIKSGNHHCDFCDRPGHTADRCFVNPDNPDNHLPQSLRDKLSTSSSRVSHANVATSRSKTSRNQEKCEIAGMVVGTSDGTCNSVKTFADSGATTHCFQSRSYFVPGTLRSCNPTTIILADKRTIHANEMGDVIIPFEKANLRLKNALYVPDLGYNLVSSGQMADKGIESRFSNASVLLVLLENDFQFGSGTREGKCGMYVLPNPISHTSSHRATVTMENSPTELWHRKLAHINFRDLANVHKHADGVPELKITSDVCRACRLGKAQKLPFPGRFQRSEVCGGIVHSDIVVGPLDVSFPSGYKYIATFLDEHSRYLFVAFLVKRSDLYDAYDSVVKLFRDLGGVEIRSLHSDGAKEYVRLQRIMSEGDTKTSFSCPYTPEHNAIAERVNRTIVEGARTLLIQADLPSSLWPFAVKNVIHVRNRTAHSTTGNSPYLVFTGKVPSLKNIRVFGCATFVLRQPRASKLEPRAYEGVHLESLDHGVYNVLVKEDNDMPRVVTSRHVTFDEYSFPGTPFLPDDFKEHLYI